MQEIRDMEKNAARIAAASRIPGASGGNLDQPNQYALGFMFNDNRLNGLFIQKRRPAWQLNKFNGIGGHIQIDETPAAAMAREFAEETGVQTWAAEWHHFATMQGTDWPKDPSGATSARVFCYEMVNEEAFWKAKTMTDEPIIRLGVNGCHIDPDSFIPSIPILLPLALHRGVYRRPTILEWAETYPR
jgi:8-oxo-dGTP pyrophosphatase MutT (NUDIX family)